MMASKEREHSKRTVNVENRASRKMVPISNELKMKNWELGCGGRDD